ncbi:group III truncated hemoglobin [Teichococcus aestuarii]|nr:group III truncated hemoglobin [Pseudoroseomonas aestuarii]
MSGPTHGPEGRATRAAALIARRMAAAPPAPCPAGLDEAMLERLLRAFYAEARRDRLLGPLFAGVTDWEAHIARLRDFWSSVALMSGRYHGQPMAAHAAMELRPEHFAQWLSLFGQTAEAVCGPAAAAYLMERAHRIARSLELGMAVHRGELPRVAARAAASTLEIPSP